jgi:hypothetical protein
MVALKRYERPDTSRFRPTEWEKQMVRQHWVDCDPVAMCAIEERFDLSSHVPTDRHGYPTA